MQRNNIAMHYGKPEQVELVRLREVEGWPPGRIREWAAEEWAEKPAIHGTTWSRWSQSAEYRELRDRVLEWDRRMRPKRWAALVQNDGQGPQTVADLAEMAVLEQLHGLAESGAALETGDIVKVARAITALQRTQLAREQQQLEERIAELKADHAAEIAELSAEIAERDAKLEALRAEIERAKNAGKAVDSAAVAERLHEVLGVRKA